jgi:vacuolar-type H+-ATPase subunit I/STV1
MAMANEEQATTPRALWMLVVVGPIIVAVEQQMNYVLVRQACSAQRNLALYVVTIVALLLTIASAMVGISIWRRSGAEWPTEASDLANRIRFISVLGILSSAISFLLIVAQGIATVHFDPCQL